MWCDIFSFILIVYFPTLWEVVKGKCEMFVSAG